MVHHHHYSGIDLQSRIKTIRIGNQEGKDNNKRQLISPTNALDHPSRNDSLDFILSTNKLTNFKYMKIKMMISV